jgi:1-acyl-sn-glycerol-3-phosphate acyltransferase
MGKAEISKMPLFGYFYKNNTVVVDRDNRRDAYDAFLKAGRKLKKGINMCIFPEGGIPKADVFLKKFKNGSFKLAIEQDIKTVPITMPDNKRIFPQEYFKGRPGIVRIKIHKPIAPNSLVEKSIENLNTSVYNTIFEQLNTYGSK